MKKYCYNCIYESIKVFKEPCKSCDISAHSNWISAPSEESVLIDKLRGMHRRAQSAESLAIRNAKLADRYRREKDTYQSHHEALENLTDIMVDKGLLSEVSYRTLKTLEKFASYSAHLYPKHIYAILDEIKDRDVQKKARTIITQQRYTVFDTIREIWKCLIGSKKPSNYTKE